MKLKAIEEILYARSLGGNDEAERIKSIAKLKKFITYKSAGKGFKDENLVSLWKGLYYCMYMADKLLFQERIAEEISLLIHSFNTIEQKIVFFKIAMDTFAREWEGIDVFRADKTMMFMCRVLREMLVCLKKIDWEESSVVSVVKVLEGSVIVPTDQTNAKPLGIKLYTADIIMEELAKIGRETLSHETIMIFVAPYMKVLTLSQQKKYVTHVKESIFEWLIKQSEQGAANQEDLEWGEYEIVLPTSTDKSVTEEKLTESDEEMEEDSALDPRAGGVDVVLPELKPNYEKMAHALQSLGSMPEVNAKKRKLIYSIVKDLRVVAGGRYPYHVPLIQKQKKIITKKMRCEAIDRIKLFDEKVKKDSEISDMSRKKKMRIKSREKLVPKEKIGKVKPLPEAEPDYDVSLAKFKRKRRTLQRKRPVSAAKKAEMGKKQDLLATTSAMEKKFNKKLTNIAADIGLAQDVLIREQKVVNRNKNNKQKKKKIKLHK